MDSPHSSVEGLSGALYLKRPHNRMATTIVVGTRTIETAMSKSLPRGLSRVGGLVELLREDMVAIMPSGACRQPGFVFRQGFGKKTDGYLP